MAASTQDITAFDLQCYACLHLVGGGPAPRSYYRLQSHLRRRPGQPRCPVLRLRNLEPSPQRRNTRPAALGNGAPGQDGIRRQSSGGPVVVPTSREQGKKAYNRSRILCQKSQSVLKFIHRSNGVATSVHVYQRSDFLGISIYDRFWIEKPYGYRPVRSSHCVKFDLANRRLLVFRQRMEPEDLYMMSSFRMEVDIAAEMQVRIVLQEG